MNQLIPLQAAADLIRAGRTLSVAGTEAALDQLPAGAWIGGTTPYFMLADGGAVVSDDQVFVTDLAELGEVKIACWKTAELDQIASSGPENGFALTIIPAGSSAHQRFAAEAASFPEAFLKPTVGWIAGMRVEEIGQRTAKVYDGRAAARLEDAAVVAYITVPADKMVSLEIVNLFEPNGEDRLTFPSNGFHVDECQVNGETVSFSEYVRSRGYDHGRLPLVGDFGGAHLNASLQNVAEGGVDLYAPVFTGVDYHFARPVDDYAGQFRSRIAAVDPQGVVWGCNCVLNYLFGELQGKAIGGVQGPVTFGEIAYQLLNQTFVMVRIN